MTAESLIRAADDALYRAKREGRDWCGSGSYPTSSYIRFSRWSERICRSQFLAT